MATVIQHKRSETASSVPSGSDLAVGELALNLADKKLYSKKTDGSVVTFGGVEVDDSGGTSVSVTNISFTDTIDGVFSIDTSSQAGTAIVRVNNTSDRDYGSITDSIGTYENLDLGGLS